MKIKKEIYTVNFRNRKYRLEMFVLEDVQVKEKVKVKKEVDCRQVRVNDLYC